MDSEKSTESDPDTEERPDQAPHILNSMDDEDRLYKCFLYVLKQKLELPISLPAFYEHMQHSW